VSAPAPALTPALRWALATAAGCLNGAAFVYWGPLALLANAPLLWALRSAAGAREACGLGAWVGFLGGVHIFGVLGYGWWIFWAFSAYTASQMTAFGWVTHRGWARAPSPRYAVALPALIWTLTEWARTVGPVALPASYAGCVADVAPLRPLLSWASAWGELGVSALIALTASALAALAEPLWRPTAGARARRRAGLEALTLVGALWGWGALAPAAVEGEPLRVAGLQGGFSNAHYEAASADPLLSAELLRTYEALMGQAAAAGADLAVWAESAVRAPLLTTPALRARLLPRGPGAPWVVGGVAHTDPDGRSYNLAVSMREGELVDRYAKVKTVPGVEARFTRGDAWRPVQTRWGPVGVLICFESIYPHAGRALALGGARLLLVLSNDAGFGFTPISHHMTNRAIVRAVELGRWVLRVGQSGITALISPRGELVARLELFEARALVGEARLRDSLTPYARWGLWWLWGVAALLLAPELRGRRAPPRARRLVFGRAPDASSEPPSAP